MSEQRHPLTNGANYMLAKFIFTLLYNNSYNTNSIKCQSTVTIKKKTRKYSIKKTLLKIISSRGNINKNNTQ